MTVQARWAPGDCSAVSAALQAWLAQSLPDAETAEGALRDARTMANRTFSAGARGPAAAGRRAHRARVRRSRRGHLPGLDRRAADEPRRQRQSQRRNHAVGL